MKAILLKDIIDETRNYPKGKVIDVFFDPRKDETAVYHSYKFEDKTYRHWFNLFHDADVKIIDTEGYDLEQAIQVIVEVNQRRVERAIKQLREAFKVS